MLNASSADQRWRVAPTPRQKPKRNARVQRDAEIFSGEEETCGMRSMAVERARAAGVERQ